MLTAILEAIALAAFIANLFVWAKAAYAVAAQSLFGTFARVS